MGKKKSIKEKLKMFKEEVSRDIPINEMILFGSRAKGKAKKDSDVDLVIVSKKFKNLDFFQRGAKMYDYWNVGLPVDFLCYTPEEFNKLKKKITIVKEAVENGIVVE